MDQVVEIYEKARVSTIQRLKMAQAVKKLVEEMKSLWKCNFTEEINEKQKKTLTTSKKN